MYIQTSKDSGDKNENKFGGCLIGFRYRILIPEKFSKVITVDFNNNFYCFYFNEIFTQVHEWHGKIDGLFAVIGDG